MTEIPRCNCSLSLSREQIKKGCATLVMLAADSTMAVALSKLFKDTPFTFPLYLTMLHMLLSFLLSALLLRSETEGIALPTLSPVSITWKNMTKLCLQGLAYALALALFNLSLKYNSLTLSTSIQAIIPLLTVIMSIFVRRRRLRVWIGVMGIAAGMAMALYRNPQFQIVGFLLAAGSAVTSALFIVLAEYIMLNQSLDPLNLLYYTALPSAFFILPFFMVLEGAAVIQYISDYFWVNVFIVFGTSILAFVLYISRYYVIHLTSSVYASSIQNVRVVLIVIVSEIAFYDPDNKLSLLNQAGLVLTLLCFMFITYVGFSEGVHRNPSYSELHIGTRLRQFIRGQEFEVITEDGGMPVYLNEDECKFTLEDDDEDVTR